MDSMKDKAAIVGVGYTPQGRVPNRSAFSFHLEAAANAIKDAGLKREDIDGILMQSVGVGPMSGPWLLAQHLGIRSRFMSAMSTMGATAGGAAQHAAWAITNGLATNVVCTYGENPRSIPPGQGRAYAWRGGGDPLGRATHGMFGASAGYAMAARRGIHEFGTGPDTWKDIAVSQRQWANLNPRAMMYERTMSEDDYENSQYVTWPFRLFDICQVSDSGRAFVVTSAERAKDYKHAPVYIMGMGQDHPATSIDQSDYMAGPIGSKVSGEEAFKMAEIGLDDIDACQIYDCYTYTVELTMMGYGFFGPGEGKDFFANGRAAPGGEMPVNTSGGLLSEVYQMGFTPLTEAVVQLQGRAGKRQLGPETNTKEPEIILVSGNGGTLQTHSTLILRR